MRYFKLPDLGEGLTEADIVEWYVKPGDIVKEDQIIVAVETAKAIVEVPSPQSGIIENTFGEAGDTVHIGEPLVEYQGENDSVSVVGNLFGQSLPEQDGTAKVEKDIAASSDFVIGHTSQTSFSQAIKASPSVRALAKRLNVDIALVKGSGEAGRITSNDIEKSAHLNQQHGESEALKGPRKSMAKVMQKSANEVVPVTIFGDADISHCFKDENLPNITIKLAKAIAHAAQKEPAMNCWFDGESLSRRLLDYVDLGVAVDTEQGLFVPVLRDINGRSEEDLAAGMDQLKADVQQRTIPPAEMTGATIILSNYGSLLAEYNKGELSNNAGRYGTPIVITPMVAIVGAGGVYKAPQAYKDEVVISTMLPLSVSFDHRAVTGGEATRFMAELIAYLQGDSQE